MKRIFLFIVIMLAGALPQMSAQESVTVHVAGQSLESLLTEEQKQSVKSLIVTGTLAEADYAYLRSGLLNQLDTLNLRQAEIDTIPKLAFYCELSSKCPERRIILPEGLKHFADSSLWVKSYDVTLELTGDYPSVGKDVVKEDGVENFRYAEIVPSVDNEYCIEKDGYLLSADGSVLYRSTGIFFTTIPEGVRVVSGRAFENAFYGDYSSIPSTVDSIGDYAFADMEGALCTYGGKYPYTACLAEVPPKLGKDVFAYDVNGTDGLYSRIYVPDGSLDAYLAADVWKNVVAGRLGNVPVTSVDPIRSVGTRISITVRGSSCCVCSQKQMAKISCYDSIGRLLLNKAVNSDEATIPKSVFNSSLVIVKVNFADGTTETLKLQL